MTIILLMWRNADVMFVSVAPVAYVEELVLAGPQPRHQRRAPLGILAPVERVELRRHAVQVVVRIPEIGNISNTCICKCCNVLLFWVQVRIASASCN